jgi:hypothetical protein
MVVRKYEGYSGRMICGTDDMREDDMRDGPPPRNRPGRAAVFGPTPPAYKGLEIGTANDLRTEKRMSILYLTC